MTPQDNQPSKQRLRERRYFYAMNVRTGPELEPPDERDELIAELRAVLGPILTAPCRWDAGRREYACVLCDEARDDAATHRPDCPVLRRDELLGGKS
jgi:hypothetical protein